MNSLKKLVCVLARVFRLNCSLDCGVYRFTHLGRVEIERFLDSGLCEKTFATAGRFLDRITNQRTVRSPAKEIDEPQVSVVCERVFDNLREFFGQFCERNEHRKSPKRGKSLHAFTDSNHETDYFVHAHSPVYIFRLPSGKRVHFHLINEFRPILQKSRQSSLVLAFPEHVVSEASDLYIRFRFGENAKRRIFAKTISGQILENCDPEWISELSREAEGNRQSILQHHLNAYLSNLNHGDFVAANLTQDLKHQLDHFLKDRILRLDLSLPGMESLETLWLEAAVTKETAEIIIDMLGEIENSRKMFLLKKKFVLECNYCLTLDKVPEAFYPCILSNPLQLEEWKRLFDMDDFESINLPEHPFLTVDTKYFDRDFKMAILSSIENIDESLEGLVMESDNVQALQFLHGIYGRKIHCTYIDPPYNTGGGEFVYKDAYDGAAWYALMSGSLKAGERLLSRQGAVCVSIDDHETAGLKNLMDDIFGRSNFISQIVIKSNPRGRQSEQLVAGCHEYLLAYAEHIQSCEWRGTRLSPRQLREYRYFDHSGAGYRRLGLRARGAASLRTERPNLFYPIYVDPRTLGISLTPSPLHTVVVLPKKSDGREGRWAWSKQKVSENTHLLEASLVNGTRHDVFIKDYLDDSKKTKRQSVWDDSELNYQNGKTELKNLFGESPFPYSKPCHLIKCLISSFPEDSIILDFFAGSGTTAHAVLEENRSQEACRRYILVEADAVSIRVIMERIKKVVFSSDWKGGRHFSHAGMSHFFKYMKLESFHDAVENIAYDPDSQRNHLCVQENGLSLSYVYGAEKLSSPGLNTSYFRNPFAMKMRSATNGGETSVDLIETFNYLLGLKVTRISREKGMEVVSGTLTCGQAATVIWRDCDIVDKSALQEWFKNNSLGDRQIVYVNGELPEGLNTKQTEAELAGLMFAVSNDFQ